MNLPESVRRQRLLLVACANRMFRHLRLQLHDFHGQSYQLIGPTGASVIVQNFGELWAAAEQLLGRDLDPLGTPWLQ